MTADEVRAITCQLGEDMIDAFLRQKGLIPYYPAADGPHPFDRLVASKDKRRLCVVEIKTKCRREAYADTGINQRHFDDYQHVTTTYGVPLFLAFVDAKLGWVYGNWWSELLKPARADDDPTWERYPWHISGIVYFPLSVMRWLHVIPEAERLEILRHRMSGWVQGSVQAPGTAAPEPVQRELFVDEIAWSVRR